MKDLGGEAHNTYTVSGNVMDALESFRAEELSAQQEEYRKQDAKKKTWFGKRKKKEGEGEVKATFENLLPELDDYHKELAEGIQESTIVQKRDAARRAQAKPAISRTIFTIAAVAAGLVLLYLGGTAAVAGIKDYIASRNVVLPPDCASKPNRAIELQDRGADTIDILEAAAEATNCYKSEDNLRIAEKVRMRFIVEMDSRLSSNIYNRKKTADASNWINRAKDVDQDKRIGQLLARVRKDVSDYTLTLKEVDVSNHKAHFAHPSFGEKGRWVRKNDKILKRFKLTTVQKNKVSLRDTLITSANNRRLVFDKDGDIVAQ